MKDRLISNEQGNDILNRWAGIADAFANKTFLQSKTVTPTREQQIIVPDKQYLGLSQVIVEPGGSAVETLTTTLAFLNWTGAEPPYKYDLGVAFSNRNSIIGIDGTNMTDADYELIGKFMIVGSDDGRYLYALQWHPSIDIPVMIQYTEVQ